MGGNLTSMLVAHIQRHPDPESSRDPHIRSLLADLRTTRFAPGPDPAFRDELRRQLVAIAPRLIVEGEHAHAAGRRPLPVRSAARHLAETPAQAPAGLTSPTHARAAHARTRQISFARPLRVAVGIAAAFMLILGGATWMSQKSLPGDALYSVKRASESVRLTFAGDDVGRAHDYLEFAETRVAEAQALLGRTSASGGGLQAGTVSPATSALITSALGASDKDVLQAWTLLATRAAKSDSTVPLSSMLTWAPGQYQRLRDLTSAMPTAHLRSAATSSAGLIQVAQTRARTLRANIDCRCLDVEKTDYITPVLCTGCSTASAGATRPGRSGGTGARSTVPGAPVTRTRPGQRPASVPARVTTPARRTSSTPRRVQIPVLPSARITLPVVPSQTVRIDSCGIEIGPFARPLPCPTRS